MKTAMVALGLMLAVVFAMLVVSGIFGLQDDAASLSLPAGADAVVDNAGNIAVFVAIVLAVFLLLGAVVWVFGRR